MKNISEILKNTQKLLDDNSPVLLTGMAVAGTFATAWFTFKGTQKATLAIADEADQRNHQAEGLGVEPSPITNQEKFLATWKFYAPAAAAVIGTTTCMVMATKISLNRTAALAGALVIAERGSDKYQDKVKELLGEKKHTQVVDAVASDQAKSIPLDNTIPLEEGQQWFLDAYSGRYFKGDIEQIKAAVNSFNQEMIYGSYASLSEWYKRIGLEDIQESDAVGWNKKNLLEITQTAEVKTHRGKEVVVVILTFDRRPEATFQDADI